MNNEFLKTEDNWTDILKLIVNITIDILIILSIFTDNIGWLSIIASKIIYPLFGATLYFIPILLVYNFFYKIGFFKDSLSKNKVLSILLLLFINFILFSMIYISNHTDIIESHTYWQNITQIASLSKEDIHGGILGFTLVSISYNIFGVTGANIMFLTIFIIALVLGGCILYSSYKELDDSEMISIFKKIENNFENPFNFKSKNIDIIHTNSPNTKEINLESINNNYTTNENKITYDNIHNNTNYNINLSNLLNKSRSTITNTQKQAIIRSANLLEQTLLSFGIQVVVKDCIIGPTVTRIEIIPKNGIKVSKIVGLSDDIALALAAPSVRIEAPVPGQSVVGIEIPNQHPSPVLLGELIDSKEFKDNKNEISIIIGKNILGHPIIQDLTLMPHILIAGATGAGKSVCINSLIIGLIGKYSPEQLKLILIDPKVVELSSYSTIPHLLSPVVTSPEDAVSSLKWVVDEMERRYKILSKFGAKNIKSFNNNRAKEFHQEQLPYIVVVIDELADLMMTASKEIEEYICRLTQKSRAAGIHLIIATQRPSVDVITGLIKSNIPSRIAFTVSSGIDSKIILDKTGAEKLLGKGDMLFSPVGINEPMRIQGAFVSEDEIDRVVNYVSRFNTEQKFSNDLIKFIENGKNNHEALQDDLVEKAKKIIVKHQKVSINFLQQQLKIGQPKASKLMDKLEEIGAVSPKNGNSQRDVLIKEEDII